MISLEDSLALRRLVPAAFKLLVVYMSKVQWSYFWSKNVLKRSDNPQSTCKDNGVSKLFEITANFSQRRLTPIWFAGVTPCPAAGSSAGRTPRQMEGRAVSSPWRLQGNHGFEHVGIAMLSPCLKACLFKLTLYFIFAHVKFQAKVMIGRGQFVWATRDDLLEQLPADCSWRFERAREGLQFWENPEGSPAVCRQGCFLRCRKDVLYLCNWDLLGTLKMKARKFMFSCKNRVSEVGQYFKYFRLIWPKQIIIFVN